MGSKYHINVGHDSNKVSLTGNDIQHHVTNQTWLDLLTSVRIYFRLCMYTKNKHDR